MAEAKLCTDCQWYQRWPEIDANESPCGALDVPGPIHKARAVCQGEHWSISEHGEQSFKNDLLRAEFNHQLSKRIKQPSVCIDPESTDG